MISVICGESSFSFFYPFVLSFIQHSSFVFASSRVLNEFILKNPNLESKKDQRELQVFFLFSLLLGNGILSRPGFFFLSTAQSPFVFIRM